MREIDHLGEWEQLRIQARKVSDRYGPGGCWGTDIMRREAFELLRTALVYHRNSLDNYTRERLHGKLRPPSMAVRASTTDNTLLNMDNPLFHLLTPPQNMVAGPHLASAAVRVSVAVLKVAEAHKRDQHPQTVFEHERIMHEVGDELEWSRGNVYALRLLDKVRPLGPCESDDLGGTPVERFTFAAVLVLIHRDNFGHGEVGRPPASDQKQVAEYRRGRGDVLNETYVCRLLEAQRVLIRWCLDNF